MHETCLIISHDPGMRLGPELGTFRLAVECSNTELTLLLSRKILTYCIRITGWKLCTVSRNCVRNYAIYFHLIEDL